MKLLNKSIIIVAIIIANLNLTNVIAQYTPASSKQDNNSNLTLPLKEGSVKFMAVGDTGSGAKEQNELAQVMFNYHNRVPFEFAILMGDNIYGAEKAEDMKKKFEDVYQPLTGRGVKFYASLGNHDESNQRFFEKFNMNGEEFYRFSKGEVSFYALNSNYMDKRQIQWIETEMSKDTSKWKIAFFHHPLYSSGKQHGSSSDLRSVLEPIFLKHKVDVVFAGHEHFYERIKPQKGIYYFITGAGGKLRKGDLETGSKLTEFGYDSDLSFMLIEVWQNEMYFQVISRAGTTIDSGIIAKQK